MERSNFEIHLDNLGKYRFRVRDPSYRIIAFGEGCNTLNDCLDGVMDIKEIIEEYHDSEITDFTKGETILVLNKPKTEMRTGSYITFSGRLLGHATGEGIENAKITIFENEEENLKETPIAYGYTNNLGGFYIYWVAKKMDGLGSSIELYAKFEGEKTLKSSVSKKIKVDIS